MQKLEGFILLLKHRGSWGQRLQAAEALAGRWCASAAPSLLPGSRTLISVKHELERGKKPDTGKKRGTGVVMETMLPYRRKHTQALFPPTPISLSLCLYCTCHALRTNCCWPVGRSPAADVTLLSVSRATGDRLPVRRTLWWGGWDWRHGDGGTGWRCSLEPSNQRRSHYFPLCSLTDVGIWLTGNNIKKRESRGVLVVWIWLLCCF